jgi:hypothetical protein
LLIRNDLIFHKQVWVDVKMVLRRMLRLTMEWQITFKESRREEMEEVVFFPGDTDQGDATDHK